MKLSLSNIIENAIAGVVVVLVLATASWLGPDARWVRAMNILSTALALVFVLYVVVGRRRMVRSYGPDRYVNVLGAVVFLMGLQLGVLSALTAFLAPNALVVPLIFLGVFAVVLGTYICLWGRPTSALPRAHRRQCPGRGAPSIASAWPT